MLPRFLPKDLEIVGYARSKLSSESLREKVKGFLKGDEGKINEFLERVSYVQGAYDTDEGFQVSLYRNKFCSKQFLQILVLYVLQISSSHSQTHVWLVIDVMQSFCDASFSVHRSACSVRP